MLDPNGRVADVVLSTNGRNVAVSMQDMRITENNDDKIQKVIINRTQAQLEWAAAFHLNPKNGS